MYDIQSGRRLIKKLASNVEEGDEDEWMDEDAGWERTPISISVPFHHRMRNPGPQEYIVGDFYHRTLVSVLREKLKSQRNGPLFHYDGFELFWKPTEESADTRVYGELYTSPAFLDAQREVHNSPREPGCNLPRVVVALMFASDATHLTNFGTAKLWPSYLFIGNESKYSRCKPSSHLCNHIAYFQAVSRSGKYYYVSSLSTSAASGCIQGLCLCTCRKKAPSRAFMAHCWREVIHAQWRIILDDEFIDAYEHGIMVECWDGIICRFYPRILIYSADYPEK